jgi:hypothetical protein
MPQKSLLATYFQPFQKHEKEQSPEKKRDIPIRVKFHVHLPNHVPTNEKKNAYQSFILFYLMTPDNTRLYTKSETVLLPPHFSPRPLLSLIAKNDVQNRMHKTSSKAMTLLSLIF